MSVKPFTKITPKMLQEIGIRDYCDNLFEFTLSLSQHIDFQTFDVLSVTRVDEGPVRSSHYLHPKVETKYPEKKRHPNPAQVIPLCQRRRRG